MVLRLLNLGGSHNFTRDQIEERSVAYFYEVYNDTPRVPPSAPITFPRVVPGVMND